MQVQSLVWKSALVAGAFALFAAGVVVTAAADTLAADAPIDAVADAGQLNEVLDADVVDQSGTTDVDTAAQNDAMIDNDVDSAAGEAAQVEQDAADATLQGAEDAQNGPPT